MTNEEIHQLAQRLRIDSIRAAAAASSGHPTSSMSAADLMAVLMARHLRYDFDTPDNPNNDHLIFSKGHASPLVYAMFAAAGAITDEELLTFRKFGSRLEGHPTPALPWVDVATGSLGQGMPIAAGIALCARELDRLPYRGLVRSAATPRWLRARSGRRSSTPARRAWTTWWSSSTSTGSASGARRCTAGTCSPMPTGPAPATGTPSRSTAMTSPPSTAPTPRPRRPRAGRR